MHIIIHGPDGSVGPVPEKNGSLRLVPVSRFWLLGTPIVWSQTYMKNKKSIYQNFTNINYYIILSININ